MSTGRLPIVPFAFLFLGAVVLAASPAFAEQAGQSDNSDAELALPQAPQPQSPAQAPVAGPCELKRAGAAMLWGGAAAGMADDPANPVLDKRLQPETDPAACSSAAALIKSLPIIKNLNMPLINWYARFLDGPQVKPMTPKEKLWLAMRNVADPFNGITILGSSAITVAADSHGPYGPGFTGWGKSIGVSVTEDMTGEFFGTFLIPSIAHQDPHYHRMPNATMKRRIAHCLYQVLWTQGDNGRGMLNYADLIGFAADDEIANLYVPGRDTSVGASFERYSTSLATAPIDNFVTEFLPDIARRIHVRVVLIQQIINQVAKPAGTQ